ncbi:universal stress protein [Sulfitobacter sp. M57]|mgnify:CR=1 FL=1|jgi:nucleotide-binding universal stress UspA family protein|uniref:universal stress protein n=1 Tax=unclassified Sulfitobacter TaxID=196795 RepID=UPI0023E12FFA|nr:MULTISPECIES: universal stress protein [unclassified Sulfitobacter]MDF3416318.1 universal stress protein [Sulfitobacter sp. KE5]MDF3423797.1 universal stress protein [Sulfitobacter sp. KE43]MDF3434864.1 universal stress protein [Sulfitobacter sp. KE42]MDF3460503.1 universal stress protein [Sulfitobacter sp. S74]MDF3464401.1 universal stress protein [Sulfitobacter sp. Ks18]
MSFKNLLLAFSGEKAFASSLSHAIKLAKHHDAWLTVIMRNGRSYFDRYGGGLSSALRDKLREVDDADTNAAIAQFETVVRDAGLTDRAEFIPPEVLGKTLPSEYARSYDLVITGFQSDLIGEEHHVVSPDLIALRSGRPVLVVPESYSAPALSDHVLVAWDGKRAAARALGDAMHIIEGKRQVTILTIGTDAEDSTTDARILRHLERHGITATRLQRPAQGRSVASVIEDTADEVGAKLIVMGAYEHSKFSQDVFGGVTHDVLKTARVPVFMSH